MKKISLLDDYLSEKPQIKQIFRIMRITTFLLLCCAFCAVAGNGYSQNARVNIKKNNVQLDELLNEIENQTDYLFVYNNQVDASEKISVNSKNKQVKDVLTEVLEGTDISFTMEGTHIILSKKNSETGVSDIKQERKNVTGIVTDEGGEALPGVSITVVGSGLGTSTAFDGTFSISVPSNKSILEFKYLGYTTQNITVGDLTTMNIKMAEDMQMLDEVVVVGYGVVKKKDLTGSVSAIQGDVLASRNATQVSQALQGAIPGLMVTRDNNAPGATANVRVRGITTITEGGQNPLIIVDGMPIDNLNDVNANDIESISVLKDAASASIYGARAAAGVLLVTTKRAKADKISFDYNFEYGLEIPTAVPEYVDAVRYMQVANELRWNDAGNGTNQYPTYAQNVIENYHQLNKENPNKYPITDWVDLMMKSYAPRQSHAIKLSGGTEKARTSASIVYDHTDALYNYRTYDRITARVNNDFKFNKYLAAFVDINFKRTTDKNPSMNPIYYTRISAPIYAAQWADGRVAEGKTGANIYAQIEEGGFINNWYSQAGGQIGLNITPIEGLKITGIFSPTLNFNKTKNFQKAVSWYTADDPTVWGGYTQWGATTHLAEARNDNYRWTSQFLVNYNKTIGSHSFDLLGGFESFYAFNEDLGASRGKYTLTEYPYLTIGPQELRDNSGSAYENAYQSWFGRIMYNYKNKYLLQANIRYDGSSRFAPDYRWGAFPSISAGWAITEENFMKNQKIFDYLKFRASWGSLGNERIGNYPYQATIEFSNALLYQGAVVGSLQGAAQQKYAIENITWETTETWDVGIDANFLDSRLRFSADYYQKMTKDMLLALQIPTYMGFDNPDQNTGKMDTKGWDLELGWHDKIGEVGYNISANISDFKSIMGDLGGTEFLGEKIKIKGSEFDEWYGYKAGGIYQTQEQVNNSAKTSGSVKVGDVWYQDISGPDGTPDGKISPEYDRVLLGGSLPRYMYGMNLGLNYKNFDFGVVFQGIGKRNVKLSEMMVRPLMENWGNAPSIIEGKYFSQYNTGEQNLAAIYPRLSESNKGNNYAMSDFWMFDGKYFRLKNLTFGYTLPKTWVQKASMQNVRLYVSASDLFTINNYPKGWDPENGDSAYPITTSCIFGISVKF